MTATQRSAPLAGNRSSIAVGVSATGCRWCNDDLEHCHESLVVHAIGEAHCMDATCATPPEMHHLVVRCSDVGCGCAEAAAADIA